MRYVPGLWADGLLPGDHRGCSCFPVSFIAQIMGQKPGRSLPALAMCLTNMKYSLLEHPPSHYPIHPTCRHSPNSSRLVLLLHPSLIPWSGVPVSSDPPAGPLVTPYRPDAPSALISMPPVHPGLLVNPYAPFPFGYVPYPGPYTPYVMQHIYCAYTYYTPVVTYGANYIIQPIVAILVCRGIVDTCGCHKVYSRLV